MILGFLIGRYLDLSYMAKSIQNNFENLFRFYNGLKFSLETQKSNKLFKICFLLILGSLVVSFFWNCIISHFT